MGAYSASSHYIETTGGDTHTVSWISAKGGHSSVKKSDDGKSWVFTIKCYLVSDDLRVSTWNNNGNSYCRVKLYEDSARTKLIGSESAKFNDVAMWTYSETITAYQGEVTVDGIKGEAATIYCTIDMDVTGVVGTNGKTGIYWISQGTNITHLYEKGSFDVSDIVLYTAPSDLSASAKAWTGTTLTASFDWTDGTDTSTLYATCNGVEKKITKPGDITFTGLKNGKSYEITYYLSDGKTRLPATGTKSLTMITYGLTLTVGDATTKTQKIKIKITQGSKAPDKSNKIKFQIKKKSSSTWGTVTSITNDTTYTITGLSPGTEYDIKYYIDGVEYDGSNDTVKTGTFKTKERWVYEDMTIVATGTTVSVTPKWDNKGSTGVVVTIEVNGVSKATTTSEETLLFTGLKTGTEYTVSLSGTDDEDNNSTDSKKVTTYKVVVEKYKDKDSSTKAIAFIAYISHGADKSKALMYKVSNGNAENTNKSYGNGTDKPVTITDNLNHNTSYKIEVWVKNMKDEDGDLDTVVSITIATKKFTNICTNHEQHQHNIYSWWQAQGDGENFDECCLTGTPVEFVIDQCTNEPVPKDTYQTSYTNGVCEGTYKKLNSHSLDYYSWYNIVCAITDGHNIVTGEYLSRTTFPFGRLYANDKWNKTMPYIYTGTEWILAPEFTYTGTAKGWKESNGE